ncbi:MAG: radical SAM family heme chaperone HemW [Cyanobacteria bacterium J06621_12]
MTNSNFQSDLRAATQITPAAAYIHLPFCRRRCYYCDFPISVVGDTGKSSINMIEEYIAALINEIELTISHQQPLETVFFGGGTPSLLSPSQLGRIIQAIASHLGIAASAEISMEIDPGTFNRSRLQGYLAAGLNRFSLGVQSFDEKLLQVCGRSHNLADVNSAIDLIQQSDLKNFSLDLISGLPQQTLAHCQTSLEQAISISPQHLSCYDLVLEPVTAFGKQYQPGESPLPNDDDAAQMYRLTQQTLTAAGYEHYEISNYARPGYQCRHNRVYWENKSYYGFGMGAASYVAGKRFSRPRTRREYYQWIEAGAVIDVPEISSTDYLLETLMLGLRLAPGVELTQFSPQVQKDILSCTKVYRDRGWLKLISQKDPTVETQNTEAVCSQGYQLRFSDPEGFLFSNTVLAALFEKLA